MSETHALRKRYHPQRIIGLSISIEFTFEQSHMMDHRYVPIRSLIATHHKALYKIIKVLSLGFGHEKISHPQDLLNIDYNYVQP